MIGAVLGNRYEILELIGTGGMANVYKAKCTLLNRNVAIKVLKEEFKDDDEIKKRFNIESQAVAGLSHTNIVSVFDVGAENDLNYIVMEYVEGITLKEYLKESGALVWNQAVDFAIQICSALQHAHRKGIIHRDIKPQNIMVTKDNVLKVMDFGIARAVSTYTTKIDNEAMGTAHYCSPEQAKGSYTDERSDIYSLGVVIYEMLTGHPPFESDSSVSVALKQIQEKPVPPTQIVPTIPASVETVVLKAMEKDAVNRFQAANTLLIELNWIKQTEAAPKSVKQASAKAAEDDKFATKKIDLSGSVVQQDESASPEASAEEKKEKDFHSNMNKKMKNGKKVKKVASKEDKTAVIAAIISAIVIVAILSFALINVVFDGQLFKNRPDENALKVPDVIGMTIEEAEEEYKDFKFTVEKEEYSAKYDEGVITKQSPEAEIMMEKPYKIKVTVSKGSKEVRVPDIINLDIEEAKIDLKELEIRYEIVEKESSTIPEGIVMSVNPGVGKRVYANVDKVFVTVSLGDNAEYVSVPDVIDKSQAVAEKMLEDAGLKVIVKEIDSDEAKGIVVKQSQPAGSKLEVKENVIIYVSTGKKDEETNETGTTTPGVDKPTTSTTTAKEVTVYLPQDREKATVKVTLDGGIVYEKTHNCSEGSVSVVVRGSGTRKVVTYVDGVVAGERMLNFD